MASRQYLEKQADRVEALLSAHRAPGRVTGGSVGPRVIRMRLLPSPNVRIAAVKALADDLAMALGVPALKIARAGAGIVLEFANPDPTPLTLAGMLRDLQPLPVSTVLLGLKPDGAPLLMRLAAPEVTHVLIAGSTGSGKSVLLRSITAGLAHTHRPDQLQLLIFDAKGRLGRPFGGLAHLARQPISDAGEIAEALRSLVHLMETRDRRGESPDGQNIARLVVIVDELADILLTVSEAEAALTRLLQRGREAGIHLVAATQRPSAAILGGLMRANFPMRLVGYVVSAEDARIASGRPGTDANRLAGRGDFLAIGAGAEPKRFQVPMVGEADVIELLGTHLQASAPLRLPAPRSTPSSSIVPTASALPDQVAYALQQLRPRWDEINRKLDAGEMTKSDLVRQLWGDDKRNAGAHARWLNQALEILSSTSTSTTDTWYGAVALGANAA